ncbi:MAG: Fpg/Nei family DNA glycosylase [Flavisolibacter sp.]|jgi:formamidopyrimidine-DNA glycosylase|nr:Fpg/Nei family DNA glycosylase [Flavisolibacter sp.]
MPELPDIEIFSRTIKNKYAGKKLLKIRLLVDKQTKDPQSALSSALEGSWLRDVYRSGKEFRMRFSNQQILGIHLMLTGDLFPFERKNEHKFSIVEFNFSDGTGMVLTDRMRNAHVKLNPEDKKGIDALDKALNYKALKEILNSKAVIKNVLLNQNKIRGIGNSYSDEILWASGISPFSIAAALPDDKIKELLRNIKAVMRNAIRQIEKSYPERMQGEIKEFLKIHSGKIKTSPTGATILNVKRGMLKTFYTGEQVVYK